jgi:hypothetical protein
VFGNKLRRLPCLFSEAIVPKSIVKREFLKLLLHKVEIVELGRREKVDLFQNQRVGEDNDEENSEAEDEEEEEPERREDQAPLPESEDLQITRLKNFFRLEKIEELGNDGSSRESFSNELVLFVAQLSAEGVCNTGNW